MQIKTQVIIALSAITLLNALSWAQSWKYDNSLRDSSSVSSRSDSMKNGTRLGTPEKSTSSKSAKSDSLHSGSAPHGYVFIPSNEATKKSDVEITKRIGKEIMSTTNGIYIEARNIEVITIDGLVTLRGKVASQNELDKVVDIATTIVGPSKVVNELHVK